MSLGCRSLAQKQVSQTVLVYVQSFKDNRNLLLTVPNVSMTEIKAFGGLESGGMDCSVKR